MKRKNIRTISFVVVTLTYLIVGAALFDYFESPLEKTQNQLLKQNISEFMSKHGMNETEFNRLWNTMLQTKPFEAGHQWKFVGALYFCTLVVTLIGYGHSTPRTFYGKGFCMLYALVGIPIFLIMFQSVGERLNSFIVYILSYIKKRLGFENHDISTVELITVEFGLAINIIICASYIFARNEGWSYIDAFYYCLITLLTIGFGDMVPLQTKNALSSNLSYACFTIFFILIGLITLASSMNLLVLHLVSITIEEQVQEKIEQDEARRQMAHVEGDVINFSDKQLSTIKEDNKPMPVSQIKDSQDNISVCSCSCFEYCTNSVSERLRRCCCCLEQKNAHILKLNSSKSNLSDIYTYPLSPSNFSDAYDANTNSINQSLEQRKQKWSLYVSNMAD